MGLALKYSNALVYAFDIDTKAQEICNEMAQANGVSGRVTVAGECTSAWIENTDASVRKLLICDCEGFERYLFISSTIPALVNCDLIIELHPMHQPDVKEYLEALFKETHTVKFVTSYDDRRKMFDLDSSYAEMTLLDRARLVQEGRPFSMEWMILSSKNKA